MENERERRKKVIFQVENFLILVFLVSTVMFSPSILPHHDNIDETLWDTRKKKKKSVQPETIEKDFVNLLRAFSKGRKKVFLSLKRYARKHFSTKLKLK